MQVVESWDAGDMGCGELVMQLRRRLAPLAPGSVFELVARDPGAPVAAQHPVYLLQRRLER